MQLLVIPQKIEPKERPRFSFKKGRIMTYTPKKTHNFEENLKKYFYNQGCKKENGCIEVKMQIFFSVKNKKLWGNLKETRPDLDNIIKSCLDGLNGVAWDDDAQIVKITAEKYYAPIDYCKIFYKKVVDNTEKVL